MRQFLRRVPFLWKHIPARPMLLRNPPDATTRLAFFGDSITEAGVRPGGYVYLVADALNNQPVAVLGAGVSGDRVAHLLHRMNRDVVPFRPTHVVVFIGINDVWAWLKDREGGTPMDQIKAHWTTLVDRLQTLGATPILCTPTVIGERPDAPNPADAMLDEVAAHIRHLAATRTLPLADLRATFLAYLRTHNPAGRAEGVLTTDGVHLNDAGNRLVADTLLPVLRGLL